VNAAAGEGFVISKICVVAIAALAAFPAAAADKVRLAIGNPGVGETEIADLAKANGFFAKHGIDVDILYTQGSAETIQAMLAGGADVAVAVGTLGALATYAKGAPIRVIAASFTGDSNMFLYVPATSPITSMAQTGGRTVAYSNAGSSSQMMVLEAKKQFGVDFRPTPTGSGPATLTQTLSGQIDVGWSGAPFGVDRLESGEIRLIMKASDLAAMAGQTSRVDIAMQADLDKRPEVYLRFMDAWRETIAWIYETPEGLKAYSDWAKISTAVGKRTLAEFLPRQAVETDRVLGLEQNMRLAIETKYMSAPLTREQLDAFVRIPPPAAK
jgi:NitT/TauT family transport system substrate-binding protein